MSPSLPSRGSPARILPGKFLYHLPALPVALYGLICLLSWTGSTWWPEWDSASYLLTGRSLAEGEGYTYLGRPFFLRPPGLAWVVSLLWTGGPVDGHLLNLVTMSFAALAVGSVYLYCRRTEGPWKAAAIALLTGTSPFFVKNFNHVLSDFPFTASLYLGMTFFLAAATTATPGRWWSRSIPAVFFLSAAFYLRSVSILLLPGLVLSGVLSKNLLHRRRAPAAALLMLVLCLPWMLHSRSLSKSAEAPTDQMLVFSYGTALFHTDPGDPSSDLITPGILLERLEQNVPLVIEDLANITTGIGFQGATWIFTIVVLAGLPTLFSESRSLAGWFALAYTLLLVVYFDYQPRLLIPLLPLFYLLLFWGGARIIRLSGKVTGGAPSGGAVAAVIFALLIAMNIGQFSTFTRERLEVTSPYRRDLYALAGWARENIPPDAVILFHNAPVLAVLSERLVYTYKFPRGEDPLVRYRPDYVILHYSTSPGERPDPLEGSLRRAAAGRALRQLILPSHIENTGIVVYRMGELPLPSSLPGSAR